ncbi:MAG: GHMP kinase [Caldilinea sp.]|nr:GHMP kinase [Caldilinea sp.]
MIISQTPLRISFFGGGTDFRGFYAQEPGMVLSSAIDKYIFVTIKERFDEKIRVGYTRTELVDSVDEVEHDLVRECLRRTGITHGVEINTMADIPSEGSGLGSSSTVTVGLLHAMYMYLGAPKEHAALAREACEVEIGVLKKPIGVQDQYIAAYGGQRVLQFCPDGQVGVESVRMEQRVARQLNQNLMLFYTNVARKAESVLSEQRDNIADRRSILREMKRMVSVGRAALEQGALDDFGLLLNDAWQLKKQLASKVSNTQIDDLYNAAMRAGALGGKITGAGGGGFLLLYCPREKQDAVRDTLPHLPELPFHLERDGTKIIFNYRR